MLWNMSNLFIILMIFVLLQIIFYIIVNTAAEAELKMIL